MLISGCKRNAFLVQTYNMAINDAFTTMVKANSIANTKFR